MWDEFGLDEDDMDNEVMPKEEPTARIGRIKFKHKNIEVFPDVRRPERHQHIVDDVIAVVDSCPEEIDGYVVLAWNKNTNNYTGSWNFGGINYHVAPEFVKEILRKCIEGYERSS